MGSSSKQDLLAWGHTPRCGALVSCTFCLQHCCLHWHGCTCQRLFEDLSRSIAFVPLQTSSNVGLTGLGYAKSFELLAFLWLPQYKKLARSCPGYIHLAQHNCQLLVVLYRKSPYYDLYLQWFPSEALFLHRLSNICSCFFFKFFALYQSPGHVL
jgi:hypothetical protein